MRDGARLICISWCFLEQIRRCCAGTFYISKGSRFSLKSCRIFNLEGIRLLTLSQVAGLKGICLFVLHEIASLEGIGFLWLKITRLKRIRLRFLFKIAGLKGIGLLWLKVASLKGIGFLPLRFNFRGRGRSDRLLSPWYRSLSDRHQPCIGQSRRRYDG